MRPKGPRLGCPRLPAQEVCGRSLGTRKVKDASLAVDGAERPPSSPARQTIHNTTTAKQEGRASERVCVYVHEATATPPPRSNNNNNNTNNEHPSILGSGVWCVVWWCVVVGGGWCVVASVCVCALVRCPSVCATALTPRSNCHSSHYILLINCYFTM